MKKKKVNKMEKIKKLFVLLALIAFTISVSVYMFLDIRSMERLNNSVKNNNISKTPIIKTENKNNNYNVFTLSDSDYNRLMWTNKYFYGENNSDLTILEYSDLECGYCKKFHNSWNIDKIIEKYADVNYIFKHFNIQNNKRSPKKAEIMECVWEIAWEDKYYEFIESIFDLNQAEFNFIDIDKTIEKAVSLWIDKEELQTCYNDSKNTNLIQSDRSLWNELFDIDAKKQKVIIINNNTKKYVKCFGGYSYERFVSEIDKIK